MNAPDYDPRSDPDGLDGCRGLALALLLPLCVVAVVVLVRGLVGWGG